MHLVRITEREVLQKNTTWSTQLLMNLDCVIWSSKTLARWDTEPRHRFHSYYIIVVEPQLHVHVWSNLWQAKLLDYCTIYKCIVYYKLTVWFFNFLLPVTIALSRARTCLPNQLKTWLASLASEVSQFQELLENSLRLVYVQNSP